MKGFWGFGVLGFWGFGVLGRLLRPRRRVARPGGDRLRELDDVAHDEAEKRVAAMSASERRT